MALLAKYYLTYSNQLGLDGGFDQNRRRTHHTWRPPPLQYHQINTHPSSAPCSPKGSGVLRRTVWHTNTGNHQDSNSSNNEKQQFVRGGSLYIKRRFGSRANKGSPPHFRKASTISGASSTIGYASAPTSPHLITSVTSDITQMIGQIGIKNPADEKSIRSPSTSRRGSENPTKAFSSPTRNDAASRRRSRFASLRRKPKNNTFAGATTNNAFGSTTSISSPPLSDGAVSKISNTNLAPIARRRCASVNEHRMESNQKIPEILIILSYSKHSSFITTTISKARNLSENSKVFVRVHVYEGFKPIALKQTNIINVNGFETDFKQAFVFSLTKDGFWATHLLIEVITYDVLGKECKLGDVVIGPKSTGNGFTQWRNMCLHPSVPISMWHNVI